MPRKSRKKEREVVEVESSKYRPKHATEMTYNEFCNWASGRVLIGIGGGENLKGLVEMIVDHALRNEKFGRNSVIRT